MSPNTTDHISPRFLPLIVLVDQDSDASSSLAFHLEKSGFRVVSFSNGIQAREYFAHSEMSLVLLDILLPDVDGIELCREIKKMERTSHVPVIFVSARASEEDRILCFESGADDFLAKPYSSRELILRATRSLNRKDRIAPVEELLIGDLRIDLRRREVFHAGIPISLTDTEFSLLTTLAASRGVTCKRQALIEKVWGSKVSSTSRSLDAHICRLKLKLGTASNMIQTVHSRGYVLT